MTNKVYIVNNGGHDYTDALRFGDLVFCTHGTLDKFDTSQMYRELADAMFDSQPEDFILLTSLTSLCCIAAAIFAQKHGQLHLLLHKGGQYLPRSLYLKGQQLGILPDTHSER